MYNNIMKVLKEEKTNQTPKFKFWVNNTFKLIQIGEKELIYSKKNNLQLILHEKIYDKIKECHLCVGHSGRDKTWGEVKKLYSGIPLQAVCLYINMCDACQVRRSFPKAPVGKPIVCVGFLTRLQLDWPELIIINGRPRHPQSQGLVERANAVVQKMIGKWLETNKCNDWPNALGPVMLAINNCISQATKKTAYEMVFGQPVRNHHDFWEQLKQQAKNKEVLNEEDLPESIVDKINFNDNILLDNNSEYANSLSPIPTLSSNEDRIQNNEIENKQAHKRIREEAEKNYIRTA
ncbi:unnamed protein product, partial [Rotaria sp. Silwood2]